MLGTETGGMEQVLLVQAVHYAVRLYPPRQCMQKSASCYNHNLHYSLSLTSTCILRAYAWRHADAAGDGSAYGESVRMTWG